MPIEDFELFDFGEEIFFAFLVDLEHFPNDFEEISDPWSTVVVGIEELDEYFERSDVHHSPNVLQIQWSIGLFRVVA